MIVTRFPNADHPFWTQLNRENCDSPFTDHFETVASLENDGTWMEYSKNVQLLLP